VKTLPSVLLKYCCQSKLTVVLQTDHVKVSNHDAVTSGAMSGKHGAASAGIMGLLWSLPTTKVHNHDAQHQGAMVPKAWRR
jgi:hypothetical protein